MNIRLAHENDLNKVNELREQVHNLHAEGRPETFKPEFAPEMRNFIYTIRNDPEKNIVVAERNGVICGYAVLHHVNRPEHMTKREQDYLDIDEFGVDAAFQRQGVGTAMMTFIRKIASEMGLHRIELNMWEFNKDALAFYEEAGFATFRRYMELFL